MELQDIAFRSMEKKDHNFILNSWLKSYRNSDFAKDMANPVYFTNHTHVIANLVARSNVIIAHNPEFPDQIYGYIVFECPEDVAIIHYIYVKFPYRKFKIGSTLFRFAQPNDKEFSLITHLPRNYEGLSAKYNLIYDLYKMI